VEADGGVRSDILVRGSCMLGSAIEEDHVAGMVGEPRG
jgi:hypothetical protein